MTRPGSRAPPPPFVRGGTGVPDRAAFHSGSAQALAPPRSVGRSRAAAAGEGVGASPGACSRSPGTAGSQRARSPAEAGSCPRGGAEGSRGESAREGEAGAGVHRAPASSGQGLPGPLGWRRGASAVYEPVGGCSFSAADQGARDRGSGAPLPPVLLTPPPRRSLLPGLARATRGAQNPSSVVPKAGGSCRTHCLEASPKGSPAPRETRAS